MKTSKTQKFLEKAFTRVPRMKKALSFKLSDEILQYDLTIPHIMILCEVDRLCSPSMGGLVGELDISYAMMTHFVDQLTEKNLVRRERSKEDRRVVKVFLTKKGETMIGKIKNMRKKQLKKFLNKFTAEDRDSFIAAFEKLYSLVMKYGEDTGE